MSVRIEKVALLLDGQARAEMDWGKHVIGLDEVKRINILVVASGDPLPDQIEVTVRSHPANGDRGGATVSLPKTWFIPRQSPGSSYFLSRNIADAGDFLGVHSPGKLELATICRTGGTSADAFRSNGDWVFRGKARQPEGPGPPFPLTGVEAKEQPDARRLLRSGGVEVLEVAVKPHEGWQVPNRPTCRLIRSPADILYYSGHGGNRVLFAHRPGGYSTWSYAEEFMHYWPRAFDVDVLILAGCNCLVDGKLWAKLLTAGDGPLRAILGYGANEGTAPSDAQAGDHIAAEMARRIKSGSRDFVRDWLEVNCAHRYVGGLNAVGLNTDGFWSLDKSSLKIQNQPWTAWLMPIVLHNFLPEQGG